MPAPTTTLLIEGSFSELADEFAQYIDALRKTEEGTTLQAEISPLLEPLRQQEQTDAQPDAKQRDEVLKKLVSAAAALNTAPEKGEWGFPQSLLNPDFCRSDLLRRARRESMRDCSNSR